MQKKSAVIIHYHIFKNAGTSVDFALRQMFGAGWASFEGEHAHDVLPMAALRQFLSAHPDILAVSSHLARPPLPSDRCLPIVFLRHPILRAKSVYEFIKKDTSQPGHRLAVNLSFREYIDAILTGRVNGVVIRNYQVIHLSDASFREADILKASAFESDYEQAKSLLSTWPAVGIVERFSDSMKLFSFCYRKILGGKQFSNVWLNRTQESNVQNAALDVRLDEIRDLLGDVLYNGLEDENYFDLQLYYWGVNHFKLTCMLNGLDARGGPPKIGQSCKVEGVTGQWRVT